MERMKFVGVDSFSMNKNWPGRFRWVELEAPAEQLCTARIIARLPATDDKTVSPERPFVARPARAAVCGLEPAADSTVLDGSVHYLTI